MNSLLLFLFLGASVALAELPFEHSDLVEFLNEEGHEELLGELDDEENDPHHDRPSGSPFVVSSVCFTSSPFSYTFLSKLLLTADPLTE